MTSKELINKNKERISSDLAFFSKNVPDTPVLVCEVFK